MTISGLAFLIAAFAFGALLWFATESANRRARRRTSVSAEQRRRRAVSDATGDVFFVPVWDAEVASRERRP
jgi:peptidoglycan/LPS O-acetylase OafA/YrhL